jgi:riboflavin synthase
MFTGIVLAVGRIAAREPVGSAPAADLRLQVDWEGEAPAAFATGDSVAVAGVCLTVSQCLPAGFRADVSRETLTHTTLGKLDAGARVNLEPALTPSTPLGGHLVSGHVDGVGHLLERAEDGRSTRMRICAPPALAPYLAVKGSVCVDGVSLTVNEVQESCFAVNLVPHTLSVTTLGGLAPGDAVNLEVDLIARYLERLLETRDLGRSGPPCNPSNG